MSFASGVGASPALALGVLALAGLALAGCAQQPTRTAAYHGHEHFSSSIYGAASPRVVADGEPVPRGGGQYLVGRPYTIAGRTYYPSEDENYSAVGLASWYGDAFHGRRTANGEVYDMRSLTAAHPTMPLPSYARVTNLANGYSVIVRVNDRGPYHGGRVMDVSSRAADVLDFKGSGTARVRVEYVGRAPLEGSDDAELLASLRTDGAPASIDGISAAPSVMTAAAEVMPPPLVRLISPAPRASPPPPPEPRATSVVAASEAEPESERRGVPLAHPPLPPNRPFDLGGSPFAGAPPRPPVRVSQNDRALYFAGPPSRVADPFARLLKRVDARARFDDD
jgi:rare lipoprotein A